MSTWKYIIVLDIKGKHNFNFRLFYYIHIVVIPTNKGANSCKMSKIGNGHYDTLLQENEYNFLINHVTPAN